jgi:hypothetical protein
MIRYLSDMISLIDKEKMKEPLSNRQNNWNRKQKGNISSESEANHGTEE